MHTVIKLVSSTDYDGPGGLRSYDIIINPGCGAMIKGIVAYQLYGVQNDDEG